MPELAEIKCAADYINTVCSKLIFSDTLKGKSRLPDIKIPTTQYKIRAESRGKELKLHITDIDNNHIFNIMFGFGMSGDFKLYNSDTKYIPIICRFNFIYDGGMLSFIDPRNFGRWRVGDWDEKRSPDPTYEYDAFCKKIYDNINKNDFKKPIYELLMNQEYCNGIGNYLRAEIIGRVDSNPFTDAKTYIQNNPVVLELCRDIPKMSYEHKSANGGNAYKGKEKFLMYYKGDNSFGFIDKGGRTFWCDKKWETYFRNNVQNSK